MIASSVLAQSGTREEQRGVDTITIARQSAFFGGKAQFWRRQTNYPDPATRQQSPFILLSSWLRVLGYRPVTTGISVNFDDQSIANSIRVTTQRMGRKAVLVVPALGLPLASGIAEAQRTGCLISWYSRHHTSRICPAAFARILSRPVGRRFLPWRIAASATVRNIRIELIEVPSSGPPESYYCGSPRPPHTNRQLSAEGERK
jgi:hypothetical protein